MNRRDGYAVLGLLGLVLAAYASTLRGYFLSDDFVLIGRVAREGLYLSWGDSYFRPLTVLSYAIDHAVWGLEPLGYHLTNVALHVSASIALYLVSRQSLESLQESRSRTLAFFVAGLFAVLPCHSESVSWIAGRTDLLATALALAATACSLPLFHSRSLPRLISALALFAAALLAKESVVVLPAVWAILLVHDAFVRRARPGAHAVTLLVSSATILAGYLVLRRVILGQFLGGNAQGALLADFGPWAALNLVRFGLRTFVPALPLRLYVVAQPLVFLVAGFLAGVIVAGAVRQARGLSRAQLSFGAAMVACYLVSLVPVLTMEVGIFSTEGERLLYLPSAFACLFVVAAAGAVTARRAFTAGILGAFLAIQLAALVWVNRRWVVAAQLSEALAAEIAASDPRTSVILNMPDNFQGAFVLRNGLQEAVTLFRGRTSSHPYRVACLHDVTSRASAFVGTVHEDSVTLSLPDGARLRGVADGAFEVDGYRDRLTIRMRPGREDAPRDLLVFAGVSERPLFKQVPWPSALPGDGR